MRRDCPTCCRWTGFTWMRDGWMYTGAACREAVQLAARLRAERTRPQLEVLDGQA